MRGERGKGQERGRGGGVRGGWVGVVVGGGGGSAHTPGRTPPFNYNI